MKFKPVGRSTTDPAPVVSWRLRCNANKLESLSPVESIVLVYVKPCFGLWRARMPRLQLSQARRMTWESARVFLRRSGQSNLHGEGELDETFRRADPRAFICRMAQCRLPEAK